MGNIANDDVVELGGCEFKRVENGLDEAQVAFFIDKLINERDKLAQSKDHIASLNRLAEKTIAEADRLAEQIKAEAAEQAKAESATIIDEAKEEAQQTAALLSENERKRTQDELSNFVNQQFGHLLEKLESLKEQAAAAQADFDNKLFQPREESNGATMKEGKVVVESLEPIQATDQTDKTFELSNPLQIEDQAELGEPQLEVEILPPLDMAKMMEVVVYLNQLSEVENTEIIPRTDAPSILVFLREPMNFVNVLGTIPGVAYVEEVITGEDAAKGEPRKVRIGLSGNTTSQEKK